MIIKQALKLATAKLSAHGIKLPHLEAEILLSAILKKPREFLLAHGEKKLTASQVSNFKLKISRRLKGEPVAYLIGYKEFYGLEFFVNQNVLIPRPETELIVDEALKLITHNSQLITIIDVGTGSGCIVITLAKQLLARHKTQDTRYKFFGIDTSKKALIVAKKNAKLNSVEKNIKFLQGDLLSPIIHNSLFIIPDSDLIILANLPYGWMAWKNNCSMETIGLKFEPEIALFTGKNGLELYEKLFKQIEKLRVTSCELRDITVLGEFDPRQTSKIRRLIKKYFPQAKLKIKKDLAGLNRLAIITINN